MLDCLATLAHSERVRIKALLHSVEQMLMLPSWKPSLWPCRALRFERTTLTGCGPVAPYPLAIFLASKAISQLLPSRAPISIFLRQIDKVLFAEPRRSITHNPLAEATLQEASPNPGSQQQV